MRTLFSTVIVIALVALAGAPVAWAAGDEEELDPIHHTADGYYLDFEPLGKVELPRLFLIRKADGSLGFEVFGSTAAALRSGHYVAELEAEDAHGGEAVEPEGGATGGGEDALHQAAADVEALIVQGAHLDAHLHRAEGTVIIDFSITRHLVFAVFAALLVTLIFVSMARRYQRGIGRETAPKGRFQNLAETLILFIRDEVARPNLGEHTNRFLPYLLTVFFFILICNLMGLVPFGATATSNLMITAVLATFTFILTQVNGSKDHWRHVFWPPGVPTPIKPILIPVEIMGLFTKPIALAIRLFANMTAGHLVILSLVGLIFTFSNLFSDFAGYAVSPVSIGFALFVALMEVLIAFIQAYIFTILSALFIGMAVEEHHHEEHDEAHWPELPETHAADASRPILGDGAESHREAATATQAPSLAPAS